MSDPGIFLLQARVPANTTATVRIPFSQLAEITESGQPLSQAVGITSAMQDGQTAVIQTGSGHYAFASSAAAWARYRSKGHASRTGRSPM